jgi:hypothetical protein
MSSIAKTLPWGMIAVSPRQFADSWSDNPTQGWDAHAMPVHAVMRDSLWPVPHN